jgi:divalent metal cation (Fe/Co/Zn/Cd) transporter
VKPIFILFLFSQHPHRKAGEKANSAAVVANAWQHRADVSTSSAVFFGLIGSMLGYPLLDPLAGVLVAGVIVRQVRLKHAKIVE